MLLVIHRIDSTNINEPVTDTYASALNFLTHEHFSPSLLRNDIASVSNEEHPTRKTEQYGVNRQQSNQSIENHSIVNDNHWNSIATQSQQPNHSALGAMVDNGFALDIDRNESKIASTKIANRKVFNKNDLRKRKIKSTSIDQLIDWKCPNISENSRYLECGCDMPYTLRCSGDIHGLQQIAKGLRTSQYSVSLLDCTLKNVTFLSDARIFENVSLHGLVISSGEIKRVHRQAFLGFKTSLQALGLPNNALSSVPSRSLAPLISLDRLDLSNNRIKYLDASDFLVSFQ